MKTQHQATIDPILRVFARTAVSVLLGVLPFEASADDFTAALAQAYHSNFDLGIARSQLAGTDESVALALSAKRPTIEGYVIVGPRVYNQLDYSRASTTDSVNFRYNYLVEGVVITQPLYRGGALDAGLVGAEEQVQAGRATLQGTEEDVLVAASGAYLDLWLAQRQLLVRQNNEADLSQQLQANQLHLQRADITVTDLGQTQTRLARATSDRILAENALATARANYRVIVGVDAGDINGLPEFKGIPASEDEAVARALAANPSITAASHVKGAADAGIDQQAAAWKPSVSASYRVQKGLGVLAGTNRLDEETGLASVHLPVYQGGAVGAHTRIARDQADGADSGIDETRRGTVQAAADAWQQVQAANDEVISFRTQVEKADLAQRGIDVEATHGTRSVLDQLNARQEAAEARLALDQTDHDRLLATAQLLAAMGEFNAEHLALPVERFDPAPHYEHAKTQYLDQVWGQ